MTNLEKKPTIFKVVDSDNNEFKVGDSLVFDSLEELNDKVNDLIICTCDRDDCEECSYDY